DGEQRADLGGVHACGALGVGLRPRVEPRAVRAFGDRAVRAFDDRVVRAFGPRTVLTCRGSHDQASSPCDRAVIENETGPTVCRVVRRVVGVSHARLLLMADSVLGRDVSAMSGTRTERSPAGSVLL